MLSGISALNGSFLANLNQTQARISQDQSEISSGIRVSQASDDPTAVSSILDFQAEIHRVTQVQSNMNAAATQASTTDSVFQGASKLLDQLISIGAQGSSSTTSAASQASLASQAQQIVQQLVSLANTSSQGQYVFGSGGSATQPYTYTGTAPKGVTQNPAATVSNTSMLRDAAGNQITAGFTAQQVFDVQGAGGVSATGNVFQAAYDLGTALARPNSVSFGAGNTVNLNTAAATLLAGGATQTYTFQLGAQTVAATVTGSAGGITGAAALSQLNSTLSAYGIAATTDSNGALEFGGATAFTVSDGGPSSGNGVSNQAGGLNIPSTPTAIAAAIQEVKAALSQISQVTTANGYTQNWIQSASNDAADRLISLKQGLSNVRDTDIAAVAVQMTTDNTALQAAMSAHATLSNKSLFSYLG